MQLDQCQQLLQRIPPPERVGTPVDWMAIEQALGFQLPAEYKFLIESYGSGIFDDFIWILHPTTPNPNLRLDSQIEYARWALTEVNDAFARPSELTPWAITENGDICYWLNRDDANDADRWQIAVNESRGPDWEVSDLSTCGWLEAVLSGRLHSQIFPENFPSASPRFRSEPSP